MMIVALQVKSLHLCAVCEHGVSKSASRDMAACLCKMPNLQDLKVESMKFHQLFISTVESLQSEEVNLHS